MNLRLVRPSLPRQRKQRACCGRPRSARADDGPRIRGRRSSWHAPPAPGRDRHLTASNPGGEHGHSLTLERTRRGDTLGRARVEGGSIVSAMTPRVRHAAILATLALACLAAPGGAAPTASAMVGAPAAHAVVAATFPQLRLPAAGELVETVAVRAAPRRSAPVVRTLRRFRPDDQFQVVLALARRRGADGEWWYRLSLPGPPNGAARLDPRGRRRAATGREPDRRAARRPPSRGATRPRRSGAPPRRRGGGRRRLRDAAGPRLLRPVGLRPHRSVLRVVRARDERVRPRHATGPRPSSASTARTCRGFSARRSRTAASGSSNDVATRLRRLAPLGTPIDIVR